MQNANTMLNEDNVLMDNINEEFNANNERLLGVEQNLHSTFSFLKQSKAFISQLFSSYYKDKFILGLAVVVLLLLITVIILGIVGKT